MQQSGSGSGQVLNLPDRVTQGKDRHAAVQIAGQGEKEGWVVYVPIFFRRSVS